MWLTITTDNSVNIPTQVCKRKPSNQSQISSRVWFWFLHGPHHLVAQELKQAAHAVTDDGGTQVTHVHLFSDVGRGEIHDNLNT